MSKDESTREGAGNDDDHNSIKTGVFSSVTHLLFMQVRARQGSFLGVQQRRSCLF